MWANGICRWMRIKSKLPLPGRRAWLRLCVLSVVLTLICSYVAGCTPDAKEPNGGSAAVSAVTSAQSDSPDREEHTRLNGWETRGEHELPIDYN